MYLLWMICIFWPADTSAESVISMFVVDEAPVYFNYFMSKFNKEYADDQARASASVKFKNNLKFLNQLNRDSEDAIYGINKYMDLTTDEFINKVKCITGNISTDTSMCRVLYDSDIIEENAPKAFDWRKRSVVTSVKDQGNCRSCYAFSAIGQIEAQNAIMNERFTELSAQQIVDCDTRSQKCRGGYMSAAFRSLIEQGGAMRSVDYPYIEKSRKCRTNADRTAVKIISCASYKLTSQEKLKQLLYNNGPIAVGIVAADGMIFYQRGIIMDSQCKGNDINHAVLLVGYGVEKGIPYWICKNSLGTNWGEGGYFRIQRGEKAYSCGILNEYMATATIE